MTPKLMSYNTDDFQSKAHMEMFIAEIEKNVDAMGDQMSDAGLLSFTVTQVWNKQGKSQLGWLFEYSDPDAYKKCQPIFKQMEADFGDIEMQLTAYRGVVLEEHIAKD